MFERFTEKARRVVFFARYEASSYGSTEIETEHLLLGLLREFKQLCPKYMAATDPEIIRQRIDSHVSRSNPIATSVDLPLSDAATRALRHAADEADRLAHRYIGTQDLLLGILGEEKSFSARLLIEFGADASRIRQECAGQVEERTTTAPARAESGGTIQIHGAKWNAEYIRQAVKSCRAYNWHWHQMTFKVRDIALETNTGSCSFDLSLIDKSGKFTLVTGGWTRDHCAICRWELHESDDDHGGGYTNGRDWICMECYDRFWERPNFSSGAYSDLT